MSISYYLRKKDVQKIVEKLNVKGETSFEIKVKQLVASGLYEKDDEYIQDKLKDIISRFICSLELDLTGEDVQICTKTSSNVYWSDHSGFGNKERFLKEWNEYYKDDYIIISEECEVITLEELLKRCKN